MAGGGGSWATVRPKDPGGTMIGRLDSHAERNRTVCVTGQRIQLRRFRPTL
jgi:hypothetical protein